MSDMKFDKDKQVLSENDAKELIEILKKARQRELKLTNFNDTKLFLTDRFISDLDMILMKIAQEEGKDESKKFKEELYERLESATFMPCRFRSSGWIDDDKLRLLMFEGYVVPFFINDENLEILAIYSENAFKW